MITLEKASELVALMRKVDPDAAIELFTHFDDVFQLASRNDNGKSITDFARLCGFPIATGVNHVAAS